MRYERSLAIADRHDRLIDLIRSGEFSSPELAKKLKFRSRQFTGMSTSSKNAVTPSGPRSTAMVGRITFLQNPQGFRTRGDRHANDA